MAGRRTSSTRALSKAELRPYAECPHFLALSDKRQRFVVEWLRDFNATRAYIAAGYARAGARCNASRLMAHDEVRQARAEVLAVAGVTRDRVQVALAQVAFGADLADFGEVLRGMPLEAAREAGVPTELIRRLKVSRHVVKDSGEDAYEVDDVEIWLADRMDALRQLMVVLGMRVEKHDVTSGGDPLAPGLVILPPGADGEDDGDDEDEDEGGDA